MLTMVGKFYPTKPAKPMGKLTLSYGVAQIVAPAMSGLLQKPAGNYSMPLIIALHYNGYWHGITANVAGSKEILNIIVKHKQSRFTTKTTT